MGINLTEIANLNLDFMLYFLTIVMRFNDGNSYMHSYLIRMVLKPSSCPLCGCRSTLHLAALPYCFPEAAHQMHEKEDMRVRVPAYLIHHGPSSFLFLAFREMSSTLPKFCYSPL